jgi:uncharacterized protein YneF (UPF0154 family)
MKCAIAIVLMLLFLAIGIFIGTVASRRTIKDVAITHPAAWI